MGKIIARKKEEMVMISRRKNKNNLLPKEDNEARFKVGEKK